MAQKCQTIIIGIGEAGSRVARDFLAEYGAVSETSPERGVPDHLAIVSHREGVRKDCSRSGMFVSGDESALLDNIAAAFGRLLGERPVSDFGFSYYLDVFVCGAWSDPEFGFHLPLVLTFIERLGHERYGSIFTPRDDIRNARLLVHPLAMSLNMPREKDRDSIPPLLANIAHWHQTIAREGRAIVPRFFIYDGFTNNIQLSREEMIGITTNFLGLCAGAGVRGAQDFRRVLNFPTYSEDFFAVLSLATLRFDRSRFREAAVDRILRRFDAMLMEKPSLDSVDVGEGARGAEALAMMIRGEFLGSELLRGSTASHQYRRLIMDAAMTYEGKPEGGRPPLEERLGELFAQKQAFPSGVESFPPESLARFFDRRWLGHILAGTSTAKDSGVAEGFAANAARLRRAWYEDLSKVLDRLEEGLRTLLGPGQANFSLNHFRAELKQLSAGAIAEGHDRIAGMAEPLPARRWRFSAIRDLWARLRSQLWNFIPRYAMLIWLPLIGVLAGVQTTALYRYLMGRAPQDTDGARMLHRFDDSAAFLPIMIAVAVGGILLTALPIYIFKRRRMRRYLATEPATLTDEVPLPVDEDCPEMITPGEFQGVLPSAVDIMARKMGAWWHGHERLGALSLVRAILKVVEMRVDRVRRLAEIAMARIAERQEARGNPEPFRESAPLYFNDDMLPHSEIDDFVAVVARSHSVKIAAQNIGRRLYASGIEGFFDAVVDESRLRTEALGEVPFFAESDVFALPAYESAVDQRIVDFIGVLADRLSHGQIFHFLSSEEEDKLIEDTQILVIAPVAARNALDRAVNRIGADFRRLYCDDRDHIWGLKVIRDISTQSVIRYMLPDTSPAQADTLIRTWSGADRARASAADPWDELRREA